MTKAPSVTLPPPWPRALVEALLAWYDAERRRLPWREEPTGYRVLVSEAMLQQTQVATVLPYFERWMQRFPTLETLAEAPIDAVLQQWAGLGYYRRAHALHGAARELVAKYRGELPRSLAELRDLPGVGPYTAGALASIVLGQRVALVDGNVARVLCRVHALPGEPLKPPLRTLLWGIADANVPPSRPGDFNQALMELGARVCVPRGPRCACCPLASACVALASGCQDELPSPKAKARREIVVAVGLFVQASVPGTAGSALALGLAPRLLLLQRADTGLWPGLWDFPQVELARANVTPPRESSRQAGGLSRVAQPEFPGATQAARELAASLLGVDRLGEALPGVAKVLTHLDYRLQLWCVERSDAAALGALPSGFTRAAWVAPEELGSYGLAGCAREQLARNRA